MSNLRFGILIDVYTDPETRKRIWVHHVRHRIPGRPATRTRPQTYTEYGPTIASFRTREEAWEALDLYQERWKQKLPIEPKPEAVALMEFCHKIQEEQRSESPVTREQTNGYSIENTDICDDSEPVLYIQRYRYPQRVYRVVSKKAPVREGEEFIADSDDIGRCWHVNFLLTSEYDPEDELAEVFALVDRDEEHPPADDPEEVEGQNRDPCFLVIYDKETNLFKYEATGIYGDDIDHVELEEAIVFEKVAEPTLQAAISHGIALLHGLIEKTLSQ